MIWYNVGDEHHFSVLTLCGVIMLAIFLLPMLMRPLDFIENFPQYFFGLFSYLLLLPTFINVI